MGQIWKDFRDFVVRGNLVEIAVAFVMGAAFGAVVNSFIFDIIMPPIGKLVGNVDFSNLFFVLGPDKYPSAEAARAAGAPAIYYGRFINHLINFLVIALVMFLLLKAVMVMRKPSPNCTSTLA